MSGKNCQESLTCSKDAPSARFQSLPPALSIDRFDGRPLRYRLAEDGPLLYSIGADRIDDGGAAPVKEGEAWRIAQYGFRIPADPMNADWILRDGRSVRSAAEED